LRCLARAVELKPSSFKLTASFVEELKPFFLSGVPKGLKVL
jgi:hypothetical protein